MPRAGSSNDYADRSPLRYFGTPLINGAILDRLRNTNFNVRDSDVSYIDNWSTFQTEWTPLEWIELRNIAYRLVTNRHWQNVESYEYLKEGLQAGLVNRTGTETHLLETRGMALRVIGSP